MQDYHRLKVREKADLLSLDIHRATRAFPRREAMELSSQLRDVAHSVPGNIAEGAAKPGDTEFRRFLDIHAAPPQERRTTGKLRAIWASLAPPDT